MLNSYLKLFNSEVAKLALFKNISAYSEDLLSWIIYYPICCLKYAIYYLIS